MPARGLLECPNCGSSQRFAENQREVDGEIELFAGCKICRWEVVTYRGSPENVVLKKDIDRLRGKLAKGSPVGRVIDKRIKRMSQNG